MENLTGKRLNEYCIDVKISNGSFGHIYLARNQHNGLRVVLKIEEKCLQQNALHNEYKIYKFLMPCPGIAHVYDYFVHTKYNVMAMEQLGPSLECLFQLCSKRFSLKTVLMLALQMIECTERVHNRFVVHCDIKPDNFVMGSDSGQGQLYIIDFGLAKRYIDVVKNKHIPSSLAPVKGTARYASLNALLGIDPSRRDDMISLGYSWLYFLRGSLPWQNISGPRLPRIERITEMKQSLKIEEFCKGFPDEFAKYLINCQKLKFETQPDYLSIRRSFSDLFTRLEYVNDRHFEWTDNIKRLVEAKTRSTNSDQNSDKNNNKARQGD